MANIKVTPEMLSAKASELRGLKVEHDEAMAKMRALINGLNDIWQGEAQAAYIAKFESMQPTFNNFSETLEGYAQLIDTTVKAMIETDTGIAGTISSFG